MKFDNPGPDAVQCCSKRVWSEKVATRRRNFTKLYERPWNFST